MKNLLLFVLTGICLSGNVQADLSYEEQEKINLTLLHLGTTTTAPLVELCSLISNSVPRAKISALVELGLNCFPAISTHLILTGVLLRSYKGAEMDAILYQETNEITDSLGQAIEVTLQQSPDMSIDEAIDLIILTNSLVE